LTLTVFWVEYQLWGLDTFGYHLINVLLHALSAVLIWRGLVRLGLPGAWWAALLFGVHPVHVESVAWISELKNTLSGFFYFASFLSALRFFQIKGDSRPPSAPSSHIYYWLSLFLFVCALFSKTVTATLPAALLLVLWWKRGISGRYVKNLVPFFVVGILMGVLTVWMEKEAGAVGEEWDYSVIERFLIAGRILWFYAGKLIWPSVVFSYPRWHIDSGQLWQFAYPLAVLGLVAWLWLYRGKTGKGPLTAVLFFAGNLFPVLGFLSVYPMRYSFVADHFQYIASVGLLALFTSFIFYYLNNKIAYGFYAARAVMILALVLCAAATWGLGYHYRDSETLYRWTLSRNPASGLALNNLGNYLSSRGDHQEAIALLTENLVHSPDKTLAYNNLGEAWVEAGQPQRALEYFREAMRLDPKMEETRVGYGDALRRLGRREEAVRHFQAALREGSDLPNIHYKLGLTLIEVGRPEEAARELLKGLAINSEWPSAYFNLGVAWVMSGRLQKAAWSFREALRIEPDFKEARRHLEALEKKLRIGGLRREGRLN
jgi:tetratricopeptide (TPR) repeat protein